MYRDRGRGWGPVEVDVSRDGLSGVLCAVVAELVGVCQNKVTLSSHFTLFDEPPCECVCAFMYVCTHMHVYTCCTLQYNIHT